MTVEERTALALAALAEITDPADVGDLVDAEEVEPGVIDLRFACRLPAYADWRWTVSTSDLPDVEPTVLEVELLPGEGSLLAPPWVPWAERLADWRRQHPDERHPGEAAAEESDDDESEDEGELDEDDLAVDDDLDELDDAELDDAELDDVDASDGAEDDDEDERAPRPADEDRSL